LLPYDTQETEDTQDVQDEVKQEKTPLKKVE